MLTMTFRKIIGLFNDNTLKNTDELTEWIKRDENMSREITDPEFTFDLVDEYLGEYDTYNPYNYVSYEIEAEEFMDDEDFQRASGWVCDNRENYATVRELIDHMPDEVLNFWVIDTNRILFHYYKEGPIAGYMIHNEIEGIKNGEILGKEEADRIRDSVQKAMIEEILRNPYKYPDQAKKLGIDVTDKS